MLQELFVNLTKVDAPIMSQAVSWVIHTNKCGSIQLAIGSMHCTL